MQDSGEVDLFQLQRVGNSQQRRGILAQRDQNRLSRQRRAVPCRHRQLPAAGRAGPLRFNALAAFRAAGNVHRQHMTAKAMPVDRRDQTGRFAARRARRAGAQKRVDHKIVRIQKLC